MRILTVDDSIIARGILKRLIEPVEDLELVGEAANGREALEMTPFLRPDLVIMDVNMPVMDGIEATRRIMQECPTSILILTAEDVDGRAYQALCHGAIEIIPKPRADKMQQDSFRSMIRDVILKIKLTYGQYNYEPGCPDVPLAEYLIGQADLKLAVLGSSTGGPAALQILLSEIPPDFPLPIVLVQHIQDEFDRSFTRWLDTVTSLSVNLAEDGKIPRPGEVLVAPGGYHLAIRNGRCTLESGDRILNQKPAVDRLFSSAADDLGPEALGILLTGMGRDGARGCQRILAKGGKTIVQDEESSLIFGMPRAAIEIGGASMVLPLKHIPSRLMDIAGVLT